MLVTVITPAYNAEKTIRTCMLSVLKQTYSKLEYIVVDDCSNDSTANVVAELARADDRIRYIKTPTNAGAGICRRLALDAAQGELFAFLDADDVWLEEKLEMQVAEFTRNPNLIICHSSFYSLSNDYSEGFLRSKRGKTPRLSFLCRNPICTSTAMFRAKLVVSRDMPLLRARQDYAFWLKMISQNHGSIVAIESALAVYTRQPNSLSSSQFRNLKNNFTMYRKALGKTLFVASFRVALNVLFRIIDGIRAKKSTLCAAQLAELQCRLRAIESAV